MSNATTITASTPEPGEQTPSIPAPLDAYAHLVGSLRRIKTKQERLSKERREHEAVIKAALDATGAEVGTIGGTPVVSFKTALRIAVSQNLLKERHPDIARECSDITEVRTFKLLG